MDPVDALLVVELFKQKVSIRYSTVASLTLLIFDWLTTFGQEVELVWRSSWSAPKIIFLVNRYLGIIFGLLYSGFMLHHTPKLSKCKTAFDLEAWSIWLGISMIEVLLQAWVNAVYQLSRKWLLLNLFIFLALTTSSAVLLSQSLQRVQVELMMPACLLLLHGDNSELWSSAKIAAKMRMPRTMLASLIPSVCFELILIGMLVFRAYSIYRDAMRRESICAGLASVLSRDSITYFVVILAVYVVNSMIWTFASPQYFQLGVGFGIVLPCVLGSRLLLNLRATDRRESLVMSLVQVERLQCLDIPPTP